MKQLDQDWYTYQRNKAFKEKGVTAPSVKPAGQRKNDPPAPPRPAPPEPRYERMQVEESTSDTVIERFKRLIGRD